MLLAAFVQDIFPLLSTNSPRVLLLLTRSSYSTAKMWSGQPRVFPHFQIMNVRLNTRLLQKHPMELPLGRYIRVDRRRPCGRPSLSRIGNGPNYRTTQTDLDAESLAMALYSMHSNEAQGTFPFTSRQAHCAGNDAV